MVPVLSSTTVSSLCAVSSASAERIRIPARAPLPVPTWIDSGVARPSAHGQAMISTAIADTSARVIRLFMSALRCDSASQPVRWIGHPV
jgi:hypothetical protein